MTDQRPIYILREDRILDTSPQENFWRTTLAHSGVPNEHLRHIPGGPRHAPGVAVPRYLVPPHEIEIVLSAVDNVIRSDVTLHRLGGPPRLPNDSFEWYLADWQRKPTLGFNPLTREEIIPNKKQVEEILVALDQFLEKA